MRLADPPSVMTSRAHPTILFAVMPWQSLEYPSLACGILHSVAERSGWAPTQIYANLRWARHLHQATGGHFQPSDYSLLSDKYVSDLAGEWVFSAALPTSQDSQLADYQRLFKGPAADFAKIRAARDHAASFIDTLAAEIVASRPDVLALSSTFTQNTSCLALAAAVKARDPRITTVMGGGNCDGPQGAALHKAFPFLDFVVRGEGERALGLLLQSLQDGTAVNRIPNLCWRHDDKSVVNPEDAPEDIENVPTPHFDAYFSEMRELGLQPFVHSHLVVETARGCWWGEKHHCTFCGLNGSTMAFRSKSPQKAFEEISSLVQKHSVLDLIVADNILDTKYFDTLLPRIAGTGWDLRIQYEIKANIKPSHAAKMRSAGIVHVQPGIESLSSPVLRLMDKGITGCRNVQALRDLEVEGITVSWNYLVGFPGESPADYIEIMDQVPRLHHLQPPRGGVTRVSLQRFSPFFKNPALGFDRRSPHSAYQVVYGLDESTLQDLAFFFSSPPHGIPTELERALQDAIDDWVLAYDAGGSLVFYERDDKVVVVEDHRCANKAQSYTLERPEELVMHQTLRTTTSLEALKLRTQRAARVAMDQVESAFACLRDLGLMFIEGDQAIGLATHWKSLKVPD